MCAVRLGSFFIHEKLKLHKKQIIASIAHGSCYRLLKGNWSNVGLLLPESADTIFRQDCGKRKDTWLRHFGDETVMKPGWYACVSARNELGHLISNEDDKKYWKLRRSHGVGWAINTDFGILNSGRMGLNERLNYWQKTNGWEIVGV